MFQLVGGEGLRIRVVCKNLWDFVEGEGRRASFEFVFLMNKLKIHIKRLLISKFGAYFFPLTIHATLAI